jgi:catechol 2,3-dioxygenase-like lactoylglutathione lyase family enzyme
MTLDLSIDSVNLHVSDLPRALDFYRAAGFKVLVEDTEKDFALLHGGGVNLGLHVPQRGEIGRAIGGVTGIIMRVADIDRAFHALRDKGVRIGDEPAMSPWGFKAGSFYDPDDHEFLVIERA